MVVTTSKKWQAINSENHGTMKPGAKETSATKQNGIEVKKDVGSNREGAVAPFSLYTAFSIVSHTNTREHYKNRLERITGA